MLVIRPGATLIEAASPKAQAAVNEPALPGRPVTANASPMLEHQPVNG